jgi:hypothetical protein
MPYKGKYIITFIQEYIHVHPSRLSITAVAIVFIDLPACRTPTLPACFSAQDRRRRRNMATCKAP